MIRHKQALQLTARARGGSSQQRGREARHEAARQHQVELRPQARLGERARRGAPRGTAGARPTAASARCAAPARVAAPAEAPSAHRAARRPRWRPEVRCSGATWPDTCSGRRERRRYVSRERERVCAAVEMSWHTTTLQPRVWHECAALSGVISDTRRKARAEPICAPRSLAPPPLRTQAHDSVPFAPPSPQHARAR